MLGIILTKEECKIGFVQKIYAETVLWKPTGCSTDIDTICLWRGRNTDPELAGSPSRCSNEISKESLGEPNHLLLECLLRARLDDSKVASARCQVHLIDTHVHLVDAAAVLRVSGKSTINLPADIEPQNEEATEVCREEVFGYQVRATRGLMWIAR